jgi:hypothetical protein
MRILRSHLPFLLLFLLTAPAIFAEVTARYIRVDNPTGFVMEFRQIEVYSAGRNVVLKHPEMISGTVLAQPDNQAPTRTNTILRGGRAAGDLTNGGTDVSQRAQAWTAYTDPKDNSHDLNPWFEVDLGQPMPIEKIVLYASRYPSRFYLDKGHRVVSALGADRKVVWAEKWAYYDATRYPQGIFTFAPATGSAVAGVAIPENAPDWVSMAWLLNADASRPPADAAQRQRVFAERQSPAQVEAFARGFFPLLDSRVPELAEAFGLYGAGQYLPALEAWKKYWFSKMARLNRHVALHGDSVTYRASGDDLLQGIITTITPNEASAVRYTPGEIPWIDLPDDLKGRAAAMANSERLAQVGQCNWPLLMSYRANPKPEYLRRWAEIMDDWSLNFFQDAARSPYEVENLFTFSPANAWGTMMEDLSDLAQARPEAVELIPALTLARVQLLCLEKYSTAWWRQARETIFNHNNGGLYAWACFTPYLQEFHAGQRAEREVQQGYERWMTLGTEPDGSMTEIGDEGHMEMPVMQGYIFSMWNRYPATWWTPAWRNRALAWHDNTFKYMFRHLAPGGYEHRFAVDYRPQRWTSTWRQYLTDRPVFHLIDRDAAFFSIPEVRRLLGAFGHVSGSATLKPAQQGAHDAITALLGQEKPEPPHLRSDWMPYTGAYYFRSGWNDDDAFAAMMACGSHGGSQSPQWPFGMFYHYDHGFPLVAAQPVQIDGLPPQQLYGRMNTFQPGTKTMNLAQAEERPAPNRWLSNDRFDFGEAHFQGGYQRYPGFSGDWSGADLRQQEPGKAVADVTSSRQILQIRGLRLFIVTDAVQTPGSEPHQFTIPWQFSLSAQQKGATRSFGPEQLILDEKTGRMRSDNPDGPGVTLCQVSDAPLRLVRGAEARVDTKKYGPRLGGDFGIAEQPVTTQAKANRLTLVSLIASREKGAVERVSTFEPMNTAGATGFHLTLSDGSEVWYQAAGSGTALLSCGPGTVTGQSLLVVRQGKELSGILLGGKDLRLAGKPIIYPEPDFEFSSAGVRARILRPIDPVRFLPDRNTFFGEEQVSMVSQTPGVEIRYTMDGSPPTPQSPLYTGPVKITATTTFAARAYRLKARGQAMDADDFEINGTHFTEPTFGWFRQEPMHPALSIASEKLASGLSYDYVEAPWWSLYANTHWLPAKRAGLAPREMDLSSVKTGEPYAMRYHGYLRVPTDGIYTFRAPHELVNMDSAASYDLRLYLDDTEWTLTQWWHGHGTWSVPLKAGLHRFQLDFADARTTPWRKSGIWRYYPRPWAIHQGAPTDLLVSGPGLESARIPEAWLFRDR